jgi:hypothetical protein
MYFIKYFIATLVAVVLIGCTQDITIDLGHVDAELVVDGFVNTDTTAHTIYLTKSAYYYANKPAEGVSGATVKLSDGTSTITLTENPSKKGAYQTPANYYGVVGRTYTLFISNVDINGDGVKEEYTASSTIPTQFHLDKISVHKTVYMKNDAWIVSVWMQDPPVERNNYLVKLYRNNVCVTDSIQEWGYTVDGIFNGYQLQEQQMIRFSGGKPDEVLHDGDKVTLEVSDITEDYLYFIGDVVSEFWGRNPMFGGQPSNIRTNVKQTLPAGAKQNAHGYFAAYSTARASTVYKE